MTKLLDAPRAEAVDRTVTIRVARAANGGWDVIAMLDEHVLDIQHRDDWHRTERACQLMKADQARSRRAFRVPSLRLLTASDE